MNQRVFVTRMGLSVGLAAALLLTGCAAIQRSSHERREIPLTNQTASRT